MKMCWRAATRRAAYGVVRGRRRSRHKTLWAGLEGSAATLSAIRATIARNWGAEGASMPAVALLTRGVTWVVRGRDGTTAAQSVRANGRQVLHAGTASTRVGNGMRRNCSNSKDVGFARGTR